MWRRNVTPFLLVVAVSCTTTAPRNGPIMVGANAKPDKPFDATTADQWQEVQRKIAPLIAQARSTYPAAKRRWERGLPTGQGFFVVTVLRDSGGHVEQVFIFVHRIARGTITGEIASDLRTVKDFRRGQPYSFPEADLVDWMIFHSDDGTEEGNVVGKFMD